MDYWKGKVAIVTGASSGMGAQTLIALAKEGMLVCGLARRVDRIKELAETHKNVKGKIFAIECDIGNTDSILSAFKWIQERFGKVHVLVNNAGRLKFGNVLSDSVSHDEIKATIDINLSGLTICTREAFKLMKHSDYCYIININSVGGHLSAQPKFSATNVYPATKHALRNLSEHIRLELAHSEDSKRIRVTNLSPGNVKTEFTEAAGVGEEAKNYYLNLPILEGIDIANAILHLISLPPSVNISELTIEPTGEVTA